LSQKLRRALGLIVLAVGLYAAALMWGMAARPQFYSANWYAKGGARRTVQVLATDTFGRTGIVFIVALVAVLYVRPSRIVAAVRRITPARAIAVAAAVVAVFLARPPARLAPAWLARAHYAYDARTNVVLVVADGLRVDRVDPVRMPNLARLASRGTSFDHAYASTTAAPVGAPLDRLIERLKQAGYATALVVESKTDKDGPLAVASRVDSELALVRGGPLFANVVLSTTTEPYATPAPYYARRTDANYRGRFKYDAVNVRKQAEEVPLDGDDARQIDALYDGAAMAIDDAIGKIVSSVERLGIADRTVIVVTGRRPAMVPDDGGIGEDLVGDASTHVPLVMFDPRAARDASGRRESAIVRDVDLIPALYELTGTAPPPNLPGRTLVPALSGERLEPRLAFAEGEGPVVMRRRMVRDDRFKLVYAPERTGVRYALFDTVTDPDERRDVASAHPEEVARLRGALWSWMLEDGAVEGRDGYVVPKEPTNDESVLWIVGDGPLFDRCPAIDAVAWRGVRFTHAYASGASEKAAVAAMLAGARPSELVDVSSEAALSPFTRGARKRATRAFAARSSGLDAGFFVDDLGFDGAFLGHSHEVTREAKRWLGANKDQRFLAFVDAGDTDPSELVAAIDEMGMRDRTIVVVARRRGATLAAPAPIVIAGPGIPSARTVDTRVRTVDVAPTLFELLDLETPTTVTGRSLLGLSAGSSPPVDRTIVTEALGLRALLHDRWQLVLRGRKTSLFDAAADPEERNDLARTKPDVVAEMKARLDAALAHVPVPGDASEADERAKPGVVHLRFVGGKLSRRVSGKITVGNAKSFEVRPVDLGSDAVRTEEGRVDVAFRTIPASPLGFDVIVDPPTTPIVWEFWLDDGPWPEDGVFGGPYGLRTPTLVHGMTSAEARASALAKALPAIDPQRDVGLFVTRDRRVTATGR
jgi:arylsulfatase A-like enzyme